MTYISLCTGAGGFDLGLEQAGFGPPLVCVDSDLNCLATINKNRPAWPTLHKDIRDFHTTECPSLLLIGLPCQGFSLGGHRQSNDKRNALYLEVARIALECNPKAIVIENVLNLRNMKDGEGRPYEELIIKSLENIGYYVYVKYYKMSNWDVPQTRRRAIFIASKKPCVVMTETQKTTSARPYLENIPLTAPNHNPKWGYAGVHEERGGSSLELTPFRISRTASDGNPIRGLDEPFPAIDTGTVWGWGRGKIWAEKINGSSGCKLWRVSAEKIRPFTIREYARLQTFPDWWSFEGHTARRQVGNAVPVNFANYLGNFVYQQVLT